MRINDKIKEIENYLEELYSFVPINFDEYKNNFQIKAACERYFEKIAEAIIDLSFLIARRKDWKSPEDEGGIFMILLTNKTISKGTCEKLKNIKSMRNFLAHKYGAVDDELVFNALTEELEKDVNEFIKEIKKIKS